MKLCFEGYEKRKISEHNAAIWVAWHGAVVSKAVKTPPLTDFLIGDVKKSSKVIDETGIMSRLKAYQGKKNGPSS